MVRMLHLLNLASVWWWGVTHIPTFLRPEEALNTFGDDSWFDYNTTFPNDFSKHVFYSNIITNMHLAYMHFLLFIFPNKWFEKVNAVGQILYWYFGQRWLFDTFPISKEYEYEKLDTPASQFIYAVPILYTVCLILDCTVEIICKCWCCNNNDDESDSDSRKIKVIEKKEEEEEEEEEETNDDDDDVNKKIN